MMLAQAQTVANFYLAFDLELSIVPVLNTCRRQSLGRSQSKCSRRACTCLAVCCLSGTELCTWLPSRTGQ